ncbi:Protein KAKU4 [Zea mays]|uniref:Protein KAKU4 n=1 Tax=Zea mays TaxID=4577 RepID=A0A1D6DVM1_MAIZE|nr:Protein KAKU4 [Zea mays]
MASLFGAGRRRSPEDDGEDDRSGRGRTKRFRLSPEEDAASPAEAGPGAATETGWLSGFVYGAKRVISSVLLFSSPEETGSGEDEEEEKDDDDDEEGIHLNEHEATHDTHGAIVPYSEPKLTIEQMVMKETFSRDECDRMVELIKSRVRDSTFPEAHEYVKPEEIPSRNAGITHDFTGTWRSLSRDRNVPESVPLSSMRTRPGSFSQGSPLQASPELCTAAVTEAKKWLEEKRQGLGFKPEDNGPCTLNTDILSSHDDSVSDLGSPVDLAKSYMQSLPPWKSPFLGRQKFNTPPSKYFISSAEVTTKEDYLSSFWTKLEESQRARIGSSGGSADAPKFWNYGSNSRLFENDTSIFSLGTDEKVGDPTKIYNGSGKFAATEPVGGCCLPITPTEDRTDCTFVVLRVLLSLWTLQGTTGMHPKKTRLHLKFSLIKFQRVTMCLPLGQFLHKKILTVQLSLCCNCTISYKLIMRITKDTTGHSGDVKAPTSEPHLGETRINSASESIPNDAGPPTQNKKNGSTTKKTLVNGLVDQSNANSGLESSGNDNPSYTNSSSAVPPASTQPVESAAAAVDVDSVEKGPGTTPEQPAKRRAPNVRRGQRRVLRSATREGRAT